MSYQLKINQWIHLFKKKNQIKLIIQNCSNKRTHLFKNWIVHNFWKNRIHKHTHNLKARINNNKLKIYKFYHRILPFKNLIKLIHKLRIQRIHNHLKARIKNKYFILKIYHWILLRFKNIIKLIHQFWLQRLYNDLKARNINNKLFIHHILI